MFLVREDFILKQKNSAIAIIEINKEEGQITQIKEILNESRLPYCVFTNDKDDLKYAFDVWWRSRCIPEIRPRINKIISKLGLKSEKAMIEKCMGLSLTDQYWICPREKTINWEDINFFENDFSNDIGNLLFGRIEIDQCSFIDFKSPDNTTDGELPKKWKILDGKRFLFKSGSTQYLQEPLNEVIASRIMDILNIPHVEYKLIWEEIDGVRLPFCMCECFVNTGTELVTEDKFMMNKWSKMPKDKSHYQYFIDCCNDVGIKNAQLHVDQMIVLDFLIANQDRHTNNFGLIRNVESLEFVDMAPIYDSGNSLWFYSKDENIPGFKDECKPFVNRHYKQIKLVSNFDWLCLEKLDGFEKEMKEIFMQSPFIGEKRRNIICDNFKNRIRLLQKFISEKKTNPNYDPEFDIDFNPLKEGIDQLEDNPNDLFDPFANI